MAAVHGIFITVFTILKQHVVDVLTCLTSSREWCFFFACHA
jgi:hypothetical protein